MDSSREPLYAAVLLSAVLVEAAFALPTTYTFSTGALRLSTDPFNASSTTFNLSPLHVITSEERAATQSLNSMLEGTSLTGRFLYDPAIARTSTTNGASLGTRGANYVGSFTSLSANIVGGTLPLELLIPLRALFVNCATNPVLILSQSEVPPRG